MGDEKTTTLLSPFHVYRCLGVTRAILSVLCHEKRILGHTADRGNTISFRSRIILQLHCKGSLAHALLHFPTLTASQVNLYCIQTSVFEKTTDDCSKCQDSMSRLSLIPQPPPRPKNLLATTMTAIAATVVSVVTETNTAMVRVIETKTARDVREAENTDEIETATEMMT